MSRDSICASSWPRFQLVSLCLIFTFCLQVNLPTIYLSSCLFTVDLVSRLQPREPRLPRITILPRLSAIVVVFVAVAVIVVIVRRTQGAERSSEKEAEFVMRNQGCYFNSESVYPKLVFNLQSTQSITTMMTLRDSSKFNEHSQSDSSLMVTVICLSFARIKPRLVQNSNGSSFDVSETISLIWISFF